MSDGTYSDLFQITVNGTSAYSDGKNDGFKRGGFRVVYVLQGWNGGARVRGQYYQYVDDRYLSQIDGGAYDGDAAIWMN